MELCSEKIGECLPVRHKQQMSTTCPGLPHSEHPGYRPLKFFPSRAHLVFVFRNDFWLPSIQWLFKVNAEGCIKPFTQQQFCLSWTEETNSTDRAWSCQIPQEKKPVLCTADVMLPNNNVIQSNVSCAKCQLLQKTSVIFLLEMELTIIFKFSAT